MLSLIPLASSPVGASRIHALRRLRLGLRRLRRRLRVHLVDRRDDRHVDAAQLEGKKREESHAEESRDGADDGDGGLEVGVDGFAVDIACRFFEYCLGTLFSLILCRGTATYFRRQYNFVLFVIFVS